MTPRRSAPRRSGPELAAIACLALTGCNFFGHPYSYGGNSYTMHANQIEYHEKATREIAAKVARMKSAGASGLDLAKARCAAYDEYVVNAPNEWATNFTPSKEILESDKRIACAEYEREARAAREQVAEQEREEARKRAQAENAEADRVGRARAQAIFDDEIKTGVCRAETTAQLERALSALNDQLKSLARGSSPDFATIVDHDFVVATSGGSHHAFQVGVGGEYHVLAIAPQPIKIDVHDGKGIPITMPSRLVELTQFMGGSADGRTLHTRPMEEISATLVGRGCSLVALVYYE